MNTESNLLCLLNKAGAVLWRHKAEGLFFNWLDVVGITRNEQSHSRILAFLLDPDAGHGQSDRFLRSFLEQVVSLQPLPESLKKVRVCREDVLSRSERIDVSIVLPERRIVLIENKVDSPEGDDQIKRYLKWLEKEGPSWAGKHILIFLTPNGCEPKTGYVSRAADIVCISYSILAEWLMGLCRTLPEPLKCVLQQCSEVWRSIGNPGKGNLMTEELLALLNGSSSHLEAALEIARVVPKLKEKVQEDFWAKVIELLRNNLQQHGHASKWEAEKRKNWFGIFWRAYPDKPRFGVMVEDWENDNPIYGVNRCEEVSLQDCDERDTNLSQELKKKGFTKSNYWSAYWFIARRGYKLDVVSLYGDNQTPDHPVAQGVAQLLWTLFDEHHAALEDLNESYPYPSMKQDELSLGPKG